jgi:glycosyltransferase involved in cell wall biosynthesis
MNILFMHNNFPAQFKHLAERLGREPSLDVRFLTQTERPEWKIAGVKKVLFPKDNGEPGGVHPYARSFDRAVRCARAAAKAMEGLKSSGFVPDVVYAHSGWGASMYLRDIFPDAAFMAYCEWYYNARGLDAGFGPGPSFDALAAMPSKNAPILNDLVNADLACTPTHWQHRQFPEEFRHKITTIHEGVDTEYFTPRPTGPLDVGVDLSNAEEIVTYAGRGMEPYRGFPQFMEAAAHVLKARPGCHVVVAGEDRVCYGTRPADGRSYKEICLERFDTDRSRLHFVGSLPYGKYKRLLQASHVHVYLTRPFVLSWSFLEAMACGCLIVASETPPVQEAMKDGVNGLLAPFFDSERLAGRIQEALDGQKALGGLRTAARRTIEDHYALKKLLPVHLRLLNSLLERRKILR